ncbi:MAG: glutamate-1-semialdehyde 2,1-aminomutase [Candidatus Dormibacteraeota bacterium]|nr:glutamate-1-semialdehyde 2,1-aminomutase [Candidatus Dormibacteraeota bacterium]
MERARRVLPGGVNSPVRSFRAVGGTPPFFVRARGPFIVDVDGNRYLDLVLAYGPLILGHLHPAVVAAISSQLALGEAMGGPTELEVELGERIRQLVPSMEMVRLVNSGTEATMSAIRLARGATGRDLLVKFAGCYHGHSDALLAAAGSGVATLALPGSPGVPEASVADTMVLPYNDLDAVAEAFARVGERVAALIVEPVAGNMGVVPPRAGFLAGLRELTSRYGAILIFDEVMTGFRVARGGAQDLFAIRPDLTCLGKVIGGGLPVGAFGGRADLMRQLAPEGQVYQAGTLSGSPLAVAAGLAALGQLTPTEPYAQLERLGQRLELGLLEQARDHGLPLQVNRMGSMLTFFFTSAPVVDYASAAASDLNRFRQVHGALLKGGVFWPPSQFEAAFLCAAHTQAQIDQVVALFGEGLERSLG